VKINVSKELTGKGRRFLRSVLIGLSLLPSWHVLGTFLFNVPETRAYQTGEQAADGIALPYPSIPLDFQATAYCEKGTTKSGVQAGEGIVAGDPAVLPLGSWIHLEAPGHTGIYQVMDTGRLIKGRIVDIHVSSYRRAVHFGRRNVKLTVLKYAKSGGKATLLSDRSAKPVRTVPGAVSRVQPIG